MTIDIVKLIREIDEDGSGTIEYDEFKSLLKTVYGEEWKLFILYITFIFYLCKVFLYIKIIFINVYNLKIICINIS